MARFYWQSGSATMGPNQPITLGAAAVMALLAAPVLAQTLTPIPTPGPGGVPRQPLVPKGAPAVVAPGPAPSPTPSQPAAGPSEGRGVAAPSAPLVRAGFPPKLVVEPLILWQPEGSTSPRPAAAKPPSGHQATQAGRPTGGDVRPGAGRSHPNGLGDPFAPMGPGAGINPFLPGMAPQGAGASGMDPRRMGGPRIPGGGPPGAGPQQRFRQGPNGMPMAPGAGSLGGPPGGPMPEGMMPPPGAVPPGMVPPGSMPPGMMPPSAGRQSPEAMPPGALPPGVVPPGVQAPEAPASRSPAAKARSSAEWSPWPSLLATLGLGGAGVLLAFLARRRAASGSPPRVAIGAEGPKNASLGRIKTGDKTD